MGANCGSTGGHTDSTQGLIGTGEEFQQWDTRQLPATYKSMESIDITAIGVPVALAFITQFLTNAIKGLCAWLSKRFKVSLVIPGELLPFFAGGIGLLTAWIYAMSQGNVNKWSIIVTGLLAGMGAIGGAQGQKQSDEIVKEAVREEAVREK